MTPGPDGGLYVYVSTEERSVVALLDSSGTPRPGWPIALDDTWCHLPTAAVDGSIRVVCAFNADPLSRAHAFTQDGRPLAGWPVELPPASSSRVIGADLYILGYAVDPGTQALAGVRIVVATADGAVRTGATYKTPDSSLQDWRPQLGPDGTGYLLVFPNEEAGKSVITSFDLDGPRAGWRAEVDGWFNDLSFGRDGSLYATELEEGTSSRIVAFGPDGRTLAFGSDALPVSATGTYSGAGPFVGPPPPVVAASGAMFLVTEANGTTVYGLDAAGRVMAGWPYRDEIGLQWSYVPRGDVGTPSWRSEPAVGPGDVLYLLHPSRAATLGGSIVAIGSDGRVRPGWPVGLKRAGSEFASVVVGPDGTAYALAIEPEAGDARSASILAIAPDSTVTWTTTIIEP